LVDITYESTEIGVVRDGVLTYVTSTPLGSFSLAREIAEVLAVPVEEAYGYLNSNSLDVFLQNHSESKKDKVHEIINSYQERLAKVFTETGDALSIPRRIYLHGNLKTEPFFAKVVQTAATSVTKCEHAIYPVTTEIINKHYGSKDPALAEIEKNDTALLISAQFFHTKVHHSLFEHR
jgi:Tfp pilus assembly PilM family ATPase